LSSPLNDRRQTRAPRADHETSVLLAIGLAIGLIVSTFAQQKEPSLSEQDRSQIVAGREGTTRSSSALKPIDQAALQAAVDATAEVLFQFRTNIRTSEISPLLPRLTQWSNMLWHSVLIQCAFIGTKAEPCQLDEKDPLSYAKKRTQPDSADQSEPRAGGGRVENSGCAYELWLGVNSWRNSTSSTVATNDSSTPCDCELPNNCPKKSGFAALNRGLNRVRNNHPRN
jgi:hypothetical protein